MTNIQADQLNHRMVSVGRDHLVPTRWHMRGWLPLDQVPQNAVQPGLGSNYLPEELVTNMM